MAVKTTDTTVTTTVTTTTAVLLAAGAGTRLGRGPKALLTFRGRPLVEHQIAMLLAGGCRDVLVVLGAGSERVLAEADLTGARPVLNPDWQSGMASSHRAGIAAALELPADTVLVALVDQPGLNADVTARLRAAWQPGRILAAGYREERDGSPGSNGGGVLRRGHPVLFDARLAARSIGMDVDGRPGITRPDGARLHGTHPDGARQERRAASARPSPDAGARSFLSDNGHLLDIVDCSGLADGRDVDTEADLVLLD